MRAALKVAVTCAIALAACDPTGPDTESVARLAWVDFKDQTDAGKSMTLVLRVADAKGRPVAGVNVLWAVEAGSGTVTPSSARSSSDGLATAELAVGPGDNRVIARVLGSDLSSAYPVHGCVDCPEWRAVSLGSGGRAWANAVAAEGRIWVLGGELSWISTAAIDAFEPASGIWHRAAMLPTPLSASFATSLHNEIYVIGGFRPEDSYWMGYTAVSAFNPLTGMWSEKRPLTTGRYFAAGAVLDGNIHIVGGHAVCDIEWCSKGPLVNHEVYDPASDRWTEGPSMQRARANAGAAVLNGKLYVAGGTGGNLHWFDVPVSFVEMYDPLTKAWTQKANLPVSGPVQLVVSNDKLYALSPDSRTFEYNAAGDFWRRVRNAPATAFGSAVAAHNGRIYVFGGYAESERWWASPIRNAIYVMES